MWTNDSRRVCAFWLLFVMCPQMYGVGLQGSEPNLPEGYMLVYSQDFTQPETLDQFQFSDDSAWRLGSENDRNFLEQFKRSQYEYKVRSPYNIGLISTLKFRNFVMECLLQQTGRDYGHRDMCIFYGFQNRSQFYYTHIATKADAHAHSCFLVDNQPRVSIAKTRTDGFDWGQDQWHRVRLVRDADNGKIEIYINDFSQPVMTAKHKKFGWGHVGFGTFDDTGRVSHVKVWAAESQPGDSQRKLFSD